MGAKSTSGNHDNVLKADGHLLEFLRSTFDFGGGGTNFTPVSGVTASGGSTTIFGGYKFHVFSSSGSFIVSNGLGPVNYLSLIHI